MAHETPPQWDRDMRRRLESGEAAALAELYDRFASLAYGIAHRVLTDEETTGRVTRDVFGRIWATPQSFDPDQGPMRSWIAGEAHRLAVARLRRREGTAAGSAERIRTASTAARADYIVTAMPAPLREALELARGGRTDYREVARELGITDAEARRRLRLGLQLLASATTYPDDVRREQRV
ncbi:RNA polymerase [Streptomyces carpaticus]|nr:MULTISPECIES: sigma factor [Streptomyces]MCK1814931.1 RNA polymerase [Streptomyces sp. XM4011]QKV70263.1 RNA polymerase [Streptomyces harbinensis]UWM50677.1 RNA polymerase [Streptomyces carpaticus]